MRIRLWFSRTAITGIPCSRAARVGRPIQPSGITKQEMSAAVRMLWCIIPMGSVMIWGLRCKPFRIHWSRARDTASAAIRGSTMPGSSLAISWVSSIGEWAEGMS